MKQSIRSIMITGILALLAQPVFAHGTEEEHQKEMIWSLYLFSGFIALSVILLIIWLFIISKAKKLDTVKKQGDRQRRQKLKGNSNVLIWGTILSLVGVFFSGWIYLTNQTAGGQENITMEHAHGMGYSSDGSQIYFAVHDGLRVYENGRWSIPAGPRHDYMGFSMVDDGFYSSGHPAPGSNKKNPIGIVKSIDNGQTLEHLALYGEVDFHTMDVSDRMHTLYVMNPQPNEKMDTIGLYYSQDKAMTWTNSKMEGYSGEMTTLAVHPSQDAIVAVGTREGLYLSRNYGDQFEKVLNDRGVTSLTFGPQGQLFVGGYNNEASLISINIETEQQEELDIPRFNEDAILYLAQKPQNENEMVFITYKMDVYLSKIKGRSWSKIAEKGTGINQTNDE